MLSLPQEGGVGKRFIFDLLQELEQISGKLSVKRTL